MERFGPLCRNPFEMGGDRLGQIETAGPTNFSPWTCDGLALTFHGQLKRKDRASVQTWAVSRELFSIPKRTVSSPRVLCTLGWLLREGRISGFVFQPGDRAVRTKGTTRRAQ